MIFSAGDSGNMNQYFSTPQVPATLQSNQNVFQQGSVNRRLVDGVSDTPYYRKTKWSPEEDELLMTSVKTHGTSNWTLVANAVPGRSGKQCRERWTNQLSPSLNKDNWSTQEDMIIIQQQRLHGNTWSKIARFLPGRSSNAIKNRWSWLSRHQINAHHRMANPQKDQIQQLPIPIIQQTVPAQNIVSRVQSPTIDIPTGTFPFTEPELLLGTTFSSSTSFNSFDSILEPNPTFPNSLSVFDESFDFSLPQVGEPLCGLDWH